MNKKVAKIVVILLCLIKTVTAIVVESASAQKPSQHSLQCIFDKSISSVNGEKSFFAIVSGYGNDEVVNELASEPNLPCMFVEKENDQEKIAAKLQKEIVNLDVALYEKKCGMDTGAALCLLTICGNNLCCVNLGSNDAVLYSKDGTTLLVQDHKVCHAVGNNCYVDDEDEIARVKAAGAASIIMPLDSGEKFITSKYGYFTTSRMLGFFESFKNTEVLEKIGPENKNIEFYNHPIGNVPDVSFVTLNSANDQFLVIGSEGFWRRQTIESVGQFVTQRLKKNKSFAEIAKELVATTPEKKDDVTVVIVKIGNDSILGVNSGNIRKTPSIIMRGYYPEKNAQENLHIKPLLNPEPQIPLKRNEDTLKFESNNDTCSTELEADTFVPGYRAPEEQSLEPQEQLAVPNTPKVLVTPINDSKKSNSSKLKKASIVVAGLGLGSLGGLGVWKWWQRWIHNKNKNKKDK